MESIVLVSDGNGFYDHLCFDFNYLEYPEKLYDLLTTTLEGGGVLCPLLEM
jgi:hypothetical protein